MQEFNLKLEDLVQGEKYKAMTNDNPDRRYEYLYISKDGYPRACFNNTQLCCKGTDRFKKVEEKYKYTETGIVHNGEKLYIKVEIKC